MVVEFLFCVACDKMRLHEIMNIENGISFHHKYADED